MIHTFRHLPTEVLEQAGINGDLLETDMLYGAEVFTYKQQGNQQSIAECLRVDISQRSQDVANRILLMRKSLKNYALRHLLIHNCLVGQSWKTGIIECIVKAFTGK